MKKLLCSFLAVNMLVLMLIGCGKDSGPAADTTAAPSAETTVVPETEAETVAPENRLDVPADLRFDDSEMHFLDVNGAGPGGGNWETYDIFAEEVNGEPINDAVWKRNTLVQERMGVTIVEHKVPNVVTEITNDIMSNNGTYQIVIGSLKQSGQLATKQYLYEWNDLPYVDLTKSWWDQNAMKDMSIGNTVYFMTGDIVCVDNDAMMGLMFNKDMMSSFSGLKSPYVHVEKDTWTFDVMYEMMQAAVKDLNGDQKMMPEHDQYGQSGSSITAESLFYGAGLTLIKKNAEDMPELGIDVEKTESFLSKCWKICMDTDMSFNYTIQTAYPSAMMNTIFMEKRALFFASTMVNVNALRESDVYFGIVPWPKWDTDQDRYYLFTHNHASMICVPISVPDEKIDMVGAVLEVMASLGKELLTPAYYDITLIGKGMRDAESEPMLDLMFANRVYDLGYIYDWGGVWTTLRTTAQSGGTNIASSIQRATKVFNRQMQTTLDAIGVG